MLKSGACMNTQCRRARRPDGHKEGAGRQRQGPKLLGQRLPLWRHLAGRLVRVWPRDTHVGQDACWAVQGRATDRSDWHAGSWLFWPTARTTLLAGCGAAMQCHSSGRPGHWQTRALSVANHLPQCSDKATARPLPAAILLGRRWQAARSSASWTPSKPCRHCE
jgi:hypothetical protein